MNRARWILLWVLGFAGCVPPALAEVVFDRLELVAKKRVGRVLFDFDFRVHVRNTGPALSELTALLTSTAPATTVLRGEVDFGAAPAGAALVSRETVRLRLDRRFRFELAALSFRFDARNSPPRADPGPDQRAFVGHPVTLDGSRSVDGEGGPLQYRWRLLSTPPASAAMLDDDTSVRPVFVVDEPGDYLAELVVSDGELASEPVQARVSTVNTPPRADARFEPSAFSGEQALLDASRSSDAEGDRLSFDWTVVRLPGDGTPVAVSDPGAVNPTFDADAAETYVATLDVSDGELQAIPDSVLVRIGNAVPVADAGADRTVRVGDQVVLDASASADVDGDRLRPRWVLQARPSGSAAALSDASALRPHFHADRAGLYVFALTVDDGMAGSAEDTVVVDTVNTAPVAEAGPDRRVAPGEPVRLDASGSYDVDGDPLSFRWALISAPSGSVATLAQAESLAPVLVVDQPGTYLVQLIAEDGVLASLPHQVLLSTGGTRPVAEAGDDLTVDAPGDGFVRLVELDGGASLDPDGEPLDYFWSLVGAPPGSAAALAGVTGARPTLSLDRPGDYVAQLQVFDGASASTPDRVVVSTRASRPLADAGPDLRVLLGERVVLDGGASFDADGNDLEFSWALTVRPLGSNAALDGADTSGAELLADLPGLYLAQLVVDDGEFASRPDSAVVEVIDPFAGPDADGDGLGDAAELLLGTDPGNPDSDGDGFDDGTEIAAGSDPNNSGQTPLDVLTQLSESSPQAGETGIAVTRETRIRFSQPLATGGAMGPEQIVARVGGNTLAARWHLSPDRRTVTLFYDAPLPASSRVRVTVDGERILDRNGRRVDADGDGRAGGQAIIGFDTLALTVLANTAVCGRIFASELTMAPEGSMFVNAPLEGVSITVDGMEQTLFTATDAEGDFCLRPAPVGRFFVHIDGRTAVANLVPGAYYPSVGKAWQSVAGEEVNLGEIYLPLITAGTLTPVSTTESTTVTFPDAVRAEFPELEGASITVAADSLFGDDGARGGMVGIAPVSPDRLPEALPPELRFPLVITVQTSGAGNFDEPAAACFPNLPDPATGVVRLPGAETGLWSFDHDAGRFELAGGMTVSEDGTLVCTDPGVGIPAPGWHGVSNGTPGRGGKTRRGDADDPEEPEPTDEQENAYDDCDSDSTCGTAHEVLLHSGEERLMRTDLAIPGRGEIEFRMQRWYRSQLDFDGPIGFGWNFSYNEQLFVRANGDVVRANGHAHVDLWKRRADGSYEAPPGQFRTLVREPGGRFSLRSPNGFRRLYKGDGRLAAHEDRFGNRMLFEHDARGNLDRVIDAYGREIDFHFLTGADGRDRLAWIRDFTGREVRYGYDARGDLVSVRSPLVTGTSTGNDFPAGRTERYTYSSGFAAPELNHNLLSVTRPEEVAGSGPPAMQWVYGEDPADPETFDRVLGETIGGTNASGIAAGGTTLITYAALNAVAPPGDLELPRKQRVVTERNGNRREVLFNERNQAIVERRFTRGLRAGEPEHFETRSFYNDDHRLIRRVFPEGNEIRYTYATAGSRGARKNIVEIRRIAGPRGGGEDLVTTLEYEPLFNQIAVRTDPRGNSTSFAPPLGSASGARYTTRFFYDYQESALPVPLAAALGVDLAGVARGLGDLNADGRTDQLHGNLVRIERPTVLLRADANEAARLGSMLQPVVSEVQWNDRGQRLAEIDAEGNLTRFEHYPENDPDGDGLRTISPYRALGSDPSGYLRAQIVDAGSTPRRTAVTPPRALETVFNYDPAGNVIALRNPRGVVSSTEVNALNEPVAMLRGTDITAAVDAGELSGADVPFAYRTELHYDANGRVVEKRIENRDASSDSVGDFVEHAYEYDILDNLVEARVEVDADTVLATRYRYDPNTLRTQVIAPEGNVVRTVFDERNQPLQETSGFGSPETSTVRYDYDGNGNLVRVHDAEDNDGDGEPERTVHAYDGFDRRVSSVDALGNRTELRYDPNGNVVTQRVLGHPPGQPDVANVLLGEIRTHHDELDRAFRIDELLFLSEGFAPVRTVDLADDNDDGLVTTFVEYDALGRHTFTVEDDGAVARTEYDGADRVVATFDALGNRRGLEYDRNNNTVALIELDRASDARIGDQQFVTRYVYDQLDRLKRVTDNAGQTTRLVYDSRDNLIEMTDAKGAPAADPLGLFAGDINAPGNRIRYRYDGLDRKRAEIHELTVDGLGGSALDTGRASNPDGLITVRYDFDGNSRLIALTDDRANRTDFAYDALDRRIRQINADTTELAFAYDRDHNLRTRTDPNGTVVTETYDALNRLTERTVARAAGVLGTTRETFAYDGLSRLVASTDDNGDGNAVETTERVYDSLSRPIEERQNGRVVSHGLSGDGKRVRTTYPSGRVVDRAFDEVDRVRTTADVSGEIFGVDYIGSSSRALERRHGNGTRLSFLDDAGSTDIGYDAVRRTVRARHLDTLGSAFVDRAYGYDRADQRTFEQRLDQQGLTDRYAYDSAHRLVTTTLDADAPVGTTTRAERVLAYRLDGAGNRVELETTLTDGGTDSRAYTVNEMNEYRTVDGVTREHSANGNLVADGVRRYAYDYRNRLVAVTRESDGAVIARYRYDNANRRRVKQLGATPGNETRYLYDDWQVIEERDGGDRPLVSYVYGAGYIDTPVEIERSAEHPLGGAKVYLHQNARMDVVALTDGNGQTIERRVYDDFGRHTDLAGEPAPLSEHGNPYGFQGRRFDPETGLYYFRNRYYDPVDGRFLQRDPAHDPLNLGNAYAFPGNRPASAYDPYGLAGLLGALDDLGGAANSLWTAWDQGNLAVNPYLQALRGGSPRGEFTAADGVITALAAPKAASELTSAVMGARSFATTFSLARKNAPLIGELSELIAKRTAVTLEFGQKAARTLNPRILKVQDAISLNKTKANQFLGKAKTLGTATTVVSGVITVAQAGATQVNINRRHRRLQRANSAGLIGSTQGIIDLMHEYQRAYRCGEISHSELVDHLERMHRLMKNQVAAHGQMEAGRRKAWFASTGENAANSLLDAVPLGTVGGNLARRAAGDTFVIKR